MILLDTSVLVYAVGGEHPLREPCRRVLTAHGRRALECTTTVEVLQEFLHASGRRRPRVEAAALTRSYRHAFDLLLTEPGDLVLGLDLYEAHPGLGAFDAVLAAVALNRDLEALISADGDFAEVPGLRWLPPGGAVATPPF